MLHGKVTEHVTDVYHCCVMQDSHLCQKNTVWAPDAKVYHDPQVEIINSYVINVM